MIAYPIGYPTHNPNRPPNRVGANPPSRTRNPIELTLVCGPCGYFQIQTTRYVTRETATLGLGGEA